MARALEAQQRLTALEHLHELWLRTAASIVVIFIGGGVAYVDRTGIIDFLRRPLHENLYYTSPMGSFQFIMQVCLLVGVILALPMLLYNILRFVEPAFERRLTRLLLLSVLGTSLSLAALGVIFAYYLTLPFALQFFNSVGTNAIHPLISVNEYFGFILGYLATFAITFQLPLILLFLNHIRPFKPGGLTCWRSKVYIGAFAISLVMPSSPDPLSQVSLAIPIIVLYEVSVFLIWYINWKERRRARRKEAASTAWSEAMAEPGEAVVRAPGAVEDSVPEVVPARAAPSTTAAKRASRAPTMDGFHFNQSRENARQRLTRTSGTTVRTSSRHFQQPIMRKNYVASSVSDRSRLISDIL